MGAALQLRTVMDQGLRRARHKQTRSVFTKSRGEIKQAIAGCRAITPTGVSDGDLEEGHKAGKNMKPGSTTACWRRTLCPFSEARAVRAAES